MELDRLTNLLAMLEKQPEDPFLNYALAIEYQSRDEDESAIIYYDILLSKHTDYLPVYYQAGMFEVKRGNIEKALDLFRKGMLIANLQDNHKTYRELREVYEQVADDFE